MSIGKQWIAVIVVVGAIVAGSSALSKQTSRSGFRSHDDGGQYNAGGRQLVMGTISGGDTSQGTITISNQNGGSLTMAVGTNTQIYTEAAIAVSSLKAGDHVQVYGVPLEMTASTIIDGALPQDLSARSYGRGSNQQQVGVNSPTQSGLQQASASAIGTVSATSPLTIALGSSATITLKVSSNARITKVSTMSFSSLKVGDQLTASVQQGSNGTIMAQDIGINLATSAR